MLNISFIACTSVELWDIKVCFAVNGEKNSKSCSDLDLVPTMPNIELVQDIFIYNNVLKFHVPRLITFCVIVQKHTHTHTHTHTQILTSTL